MEHYIIIKVIEESTEGKTKAGLLCRMIHRFVAENDIRIIDNLIRQDRSEFPNGKPVPYAEAKALFDRATCF